MPMKEKTREDDDQCGKERSGISASASVGNATPYRSGFAVEVTGDYANHAVEFPRPDSGLHYRCAAGSRF